MRVSAAAAPSLCGRKALCRDTDLRVVVRVLFSSFVTSALVFVFVRNPVDLPAKVARGPDSYGGRTAMVV
jgi:hypothetical protein